MWRRCDGCGTWRLLDTENDRARPYSAPLDPCRIDGRKRLSTTAAPMSAYTTSPTPTSGPHQLGRSATHHTIATTTHTGPTTRIAVDALRVTSAVTPATSAPITKNGGNTVANEPPALATPRPPRNRVHTGHTCPTIDAVPAAYAAASPMSRPRNPASAPLHASSTTTSRPHF